MLSAIGQRIYRAIRQTRYLLSFNKGNQRIVIFIGGWFHPLRVIWLNENTGKGLLKTTYSQMEKVLQNKVMERGKYVAIHQTKE